MPECPTCGRGTEEGANFCSHCGSYLRARATDRAIDQMIQDARRAVDDNPTDASARFNLALACKLGGLNQWALEEFQRVAQLQPDFADAHYEIGLLHAKAGHAQEAEAALRRALDLEPSHKKASDLLRRLAHT